MLQLTEENIKKIINETINKYIQNNLTYSLEELKNYLSQNSNKEIKQLDNSLNTSYEAYNYFDNPIIVHDIWAIHYTSLECWEEILKNGFKGTLDYNSLGYTHQYKNDISDKGWCFALPIDNDYIGNDRGYGDIALLIKTDGVRVFHKGDHDYEIIFNNSCVKECYSFIYEDDYNCWSLINDNNLKININKINKYGGYYLSDIKQFVFPHILNGVKFIINS